LPPTISAVDRSVNAWHHHRLHLTPVNLLPTSNGFSCRALAFDLLRHRGCITSVWSIDMSISSLAGAGAQAQRAATTPSQAKTSATQTSTTQAASAAGSSTGTASSAFDSIVDGISVEMPNGLSVGVFHFSQGAGGQAGGTSSSNGSNFNQMLGSIEQLVASLENYTGSPSSTAAHVPSAATTADGTSAGSGSPDSSIDGINVKMPNGFSIEVFHADQGNGTSTDSDASSAQMVDTIEQLVAAFEKYPAVAAGAYSSTAANASGTTASGNLNAVA
jgi:hypothetical protein